MAEALAITPQALRLVDEELVQRDWTRIRFALALGILGAGLGAATIIINFLTQFEGIGELERITPGQSVLFGSGGAMAGFLVAGPAAYWIYGVRPTFSSHGRRARKLWIWLLLAGVFVFFYALLMGGVFLPSSQYFFLFLSSTFTVPNIVARVFNLVTATWVVFSVLNGFKLLFTTAIFGVAFGPSAWIIDRFSTSTHQVTSKYGPIAFASIISITAVAFATLAPEELLVRLGP